MRIILILLLLIPVLHCAAQNDKRLRRIDADLEQLLETWKAPGFAVAVVEKNQIIYARGFGYRDREKQLPVTANTLFAIGSCSKAFTSAVLGQLQQETDLSLDDKPGEYIEGFSFYNNEMNDQIAIRDIMCHRTGLPRHDYSWYFFPTDDRDSLIARVAFQEPTFGIRERWQYNNFMFLAQGMIAEKVTGKSWEQNIKDRFFGPLNMERSTLDIEGLVADSDHAIGYETVNDDEIRPMDYYHIRAMAPAGSINSSVNEIANWVRTWINGGEWNGKQIIPANYLKEAISPQMIVTNSVPDADVPDVHLQNYGYGWFLASYRGHYRVEHGGNINGFSASTTFYPTDSIGIVVLANQNGSPIPSLVRNIISDRMLGLEGIDWSGKLEKQRKDQMAAQQATVASASKNRKMNTKPSHEMKAYTGTFLSPAAGKADIFLRNDSLFLRSSEFEIWMRHYHYDVFEPLMRNCYGIDTTASLLRAVFETNASGDISAFTMNLEQGLDPVRFERQVNELDLTDEELQSYVGDYELEGVSAKFYLKDDNRLYLTVPNQPEYTLIPTDEHTFSIKDLEGFSIKFMMDGEKAEKAIFNQPNGTFTATRKKSN